MAVSAVKKEAAKQPAEADAPSPQPKKRAFNWKLPVIALCVIGAAGGGAYWYSIQPAAEAGAKVLPAKPPQFMPLESFTVNLQHEESSQYLQVALTLKVADNAAVDAIKLHMPEVRHNILLLLSSQKASALVTLEGKRKLAKDILDAINAIVAPQPAPAEAAPAAAAPAPAATADAKPADADAKPADDADAKPAAEAEAKPAEAADAPAAAVAPALPVLSVLFTSFIVQ